MCLADVPSEPSDFFPLYVNYQERFSAAGRTRCALCFPYSSIIIISTTKRELIIVLSYAYDLLFFQRRIFQTRREGKRSWGIIWLSAAIYDYSEPSIHWPLKLSDRKYITFILSVGFCMWLLLLFYGYRIGLWVVIRSCKILQGFDFKRGLCLTV